MLTNDFFERGFQIFNGIEYVSLIDKKHLEWEYEEQTKTMNVPLSNLYCSTLLKCIFDSIYDKCLKEHCTDYEMINSPRLWKGVNPEVEDWHSDHEEGDNCRFLLYFDDMRSVNGGSVYFRDEKNEYKIKPYPGLLIAINCEERFQHRAEQTTIERIIACFPYKLKWKE